MMKPLTVQWKLEDFEKPMFTGDNPEHCVHVARRDGMIAVRNSNHSWQDGPIVEFTPGEWDVFRRSMLEGQFNFS